MRNGNPPCVTSSRRILLLGLKRENVFQMTQVTNGVAQLPTPITPVLDGIGNAVGGWDDGQIWQGASKAKNPPGRRVFNQINEATD